MPLGNGKNVFFTSALENGFWKRKNVFPIRFFVQFFCEKQSLLKPINMGLAYYANIRKVVATTHDDFDLMALLEYSVLSFELKTLGLTLVS